MVTAASTSTRPKPYQLWKLKLAALVVQLSSAWMPPSQIPLTVECTFSAVLARMYLTSRPVRLLLACKSRAIAPDSTGAAEEEPLKVLV